MYDSSTKPYLIRAIYEWCVDQSYTPYVAVQVDDHTKVPVEFIKDGQIVLNVSYTATRHLKIGNEFINFSARFNGTSRELEIPIQFINFSARFNGTSRELEIPIQAVIGIFAKENGQGMFFQATEENTASAVAQPAEMPSAPPPETSPPDKPPRGSHLKIVK